MNRSRRSRWSDPRVHDAPIPAFTMVRNPQHLSPGEKTLIYTHYVDGVADVLRDAIQSAGYRVGLLTGDTDADHLKDFLKPDGNIDVLVASSRIGTGVNGLQYVCNKLIINSLPWTNA